jgi:hypothetical protein
MNLSRKCGVVLIMLIGITTGSSVVQAGSEGTSSASRGPSGDAGAKKWLSPSKAAPVKPIVVSPADAAKLGEIVKKVEAELGKSGESSQDARVKLAKSGEAAASPQSIQDLIGIIGKILGPIGGGGMKSTSANPIVVSSEDVAKLGEIVKKVEAESGKSGESSQDAKVKLLKSGEAAASQPSVQSLIDIIRGIFGGLNGML